MLILAAVHRFRSQHCRRNGCHRYSNTTRNQNQNDRNDDDVSSDGEIDEEDHHDFDHQSTWRIRWLRKALIIGSFSVLMLALSSSTSSLSLPASSSSLSVLLMTTPTIRTSLRHNVHAVANVEMDKNAPGWKEGVIREAEVQQVLNVLHRMGITNLCHPSSNDYAPRIPQCTGTIGNEHSMEPNFHLQRMLLETTTLAVDDSAATASTTTTTSASSSSSSDILTNNAINNNNDNNIIIATNNIKGSRNNGLWFTLLNVGACLVCIMSVALMSCMFLGFMTLDPLDLRIQIRASVNAEVRDRAAQLLPIIEQNHRLLVTLLLSEAIFYESMPLLLDNLLPSWAAILMSVTVLLVFGEIIPSAFVTGPEQLRWASRLTPLMNFLLWFLHPLAAPLTWMLDTLVPPGEAEDEFYDRGELSALIKIQFEDRERANKRQIGGAGLTPHSRALRGATLPAMAGPPMSVTVAEKSRGWRNLKREILEAVEHRRVEQLHQLQLELHLQKSQQSKYTPPAPLSPGGASSASGMGGGPGGGAYHHHQFHHSTNSIRSSGDHGGGGGGAGGGGVVALKETRGQNRAMSIGSDTESVQSYCTPPAYEQYAPPLHQAEVNVLEGALTMKTKCAWDVYTPLRKMFSVPYDLELDRNTIAEIYSEGYSRIPVYERPPPPHQDRKYAIRGVLMTRHLIMIDWDDERLVSSLPLYTPPCVSPRMNLVDLLQLLQQGGSHIAFVCAGPDMANKALEDDEPIPVEAGFMGLVTLEDVLEAILQARIYDEDDVADRDLASATLTQWAAKILQRFYRRKRAMARLSIGSAGEMGASFEDATALIAAESGAATTDASNGTSSNGTSLVQHQQHQQWQPNHQHGASPYRPPSRNVADSNRFGGPSNAAEPSIPEEIDVEIFGSNSFIDPDATEDTPLLRSGVSAMSMSNNSNHRLS